MGSFRLLKDLFWIQVNALDAGILLRGGITIGKAVHLPGLSGTVFGPAVTQAYDLEHDIAIYPRIIWRDENILELARQAPLVSGDILKTSIEEYVGVDCDGWSYIDYISGKIFDREIQYTFHTNLSTWIYRASASKILTDQLHHDPPHPKKILEKWKWVERQCNKWEPGPRHYP